MEMNLYIIQISPCPEKNIIDGWALESKQTHSKTNTCLKRHQRPHNRRLMIQHKGQDKETTSIILQDVQDATFETLKYVKLIACLCIFTIEGNTPTFLKKQYLGLMFTIPYLSLSMLLRYLVKCDSDETQWLIWGYKMVPYCIRPACLDCFHFFSNFSSIWHGVVTLFHL